MKRLLTCFILPWVLVTTSCKPKFDETSPKIAPVTEAVFASGVIEPKDAYTVTSLSDGFIVHSYVVENDLVHDGQLLFQLDNRQQRTQVAIAQTNVTFARISADNNSPTLLQQKAQVEVARVKQQNDSVTLARYQHLYTTNSVSRQDLDNAQMTYQSSLSSYHASLDNYKATQDKVRQDLLNNQSLLQNAEEGNQYYNLVAVGPSKVYQIFKKTRRPSAQGRSGGTIGQPGFYSY